VCDFADHVDRITTRRTELRAQLRVPDWKKDDLGRRTETTVKKRRRYNVEREKRRPLSSVNCKKMTSDRAAH